MRRTPAAATEEPAKAPAPPPTSTELTVGFLCASIFSLAYFVIPAYLLFALLCVWAAPTAPLTAMVLLPIVTSLMCPPIAALWVLQSWPFQCILKYFDFEDVMEIPEEEFIALLDDDTRPVLVGFHPHGIFPFCGLCCAVKWSTRWWSPHSSATAVADSVLFTPLLKHVIGILGLVSASSASLDRALQTNKSVVLYPGGTSEIFLCSSEEERVHLSDRKGFVKIALRNGCALVPTYLFGNTQTLRLVRWPVLRWLSRRTGVAMTYLYGRFHLPLPLPTKCLGVMGRPLMLPKIAHPTPEDVDKYHAMYVSEVQRIFSEHKHRVPGYEHKELVIE